MKYYRSISDALNAHDSRWERPFLCPVHGDIHPSASVNVQKGVWYCYTCGAKGKAAGEIYQDDEFSVEEIERLLAEPRIYSESWLSLYSAVHPYWRTRFTDEAIAQFQLGTDPFTDRPCYPIRCESSYLLGVVTRCLDDSGPKYRYPTGVKIHQLLFGFHPQHYPDRVVLVEGALDVIALWEASIAAYGVYGSHLSDRQTSLLRSRAPDQVVLAFDNDRAGRKATAEAAERLVDLDLTTMNWDNWENYNDVAEIPVSERYTAIFGDTP